jgi:hypothetical protein
MISESRYGSCLTGYSMLERVEGMVEDSGGKYGDGKRGMSAQVEDKVLYGICCEYEE